MHSVTCKFFNSPRGCRRGGECPYIHRTLMQHTAPPPPPDHHRLGRSCDLAWPQEDEVNGEAYATNAGAPSHKKRESRRDRESDLQRAVGEQIETRRRKKKPPVDKWVAKKPMPSLPNEMWDKILSHCDPSSLAAVCGVCKSMRRTALPHRTAFRIDAAKLDQGQVLDTLMHIRVNFPHLTSVSLVNGNLRGFTFYASDEHSRFTLFPENLRHLSMENSEGLDDDQVKALCAELPRLRHMDLSKCFELSNQILRYLPTTLTILNLCGVHDINANALRLLPHLKNLEILDLKACWRLGSLYSQQNPFTSSGPYYSYFPSSPAITTYSAFTHLQSLPRLHTLSLSRIYCLADNDIAVLPRHLKVLDVSFCFHISDYVRPSLPAELTELYCQGCDLITFDTWESGDHGLTVLGETTTTTSTAESDSMQEGEVQPGDDQNPSAVDTNNTNAITSSRPRHTMTWIGRTGRSSNTGGGRRERNKRQLRIVRGEWSLPERCCVE